MKTYQIRHIFSGCIMVTYTLLKPAKKTVEKWNAEQGKVAYEVIEKA